MGDGVAGQPLISFGQVRRWLGDAVPQVSTPVSPWCVHVRSDGAIEVARSRAAVTLVEPGHVTAEPFDHLLVVGPHERLAHALEALEDRRVHLLGLPCAEAVLVRVIESALPRPRRMRGRG